MERGVLYNDTTSVSMGNRECTRIMNVRIRETQVLPHGLQATLSDKIWDVKRRGYYSGRNTNPSLDHCYRLQKSSKRYLSQKIVRKMFIRIENSTVWLLEWYVVVRH